MSQKHLDSRQKFTFSAFARRKTHFKSAKVNWSESFNSYLTSGLRNIWKANSFLQIQNGHNQRGEILNFHWSCIANKLSFDNIATNFVSLWFIPAAFVKDNNGVSFSLNAGMFFGQRLWDEKFQNQTEQESWKGFTLCGTWMLAVSLRPMTLLPKTQQYCITGIECEHIMIAISHGCPSVCLIPIE
jgi:hypothetical protein